MDQKKSLKYRHEYKYLISEIELELLRNRVKYLLKNDPHAGESGAYTIRSLYFDDYTDSCMRENEYGTDPREKFRIRIYNHSLERITLECKRKEKGKTLKTSCPLSVEQVRELMQGKAIPDLSAQPPLLRRLTLQMLTRRLRPVVIVEYERIPYVYKNGNVRITLDKNISCSSAISTFLDEKVPLRPVMPLNRQLLEVKFDEYLPDFIFRNLQLYSLRQTAFSKYYICRKFSR